MEDRMRKLVNLSRRTAITTSVALAAAVATAVGLVASASAAPGHPSEKATASCSLATLHGTYLFDGDGTALTDTGDHPMAYAGSFYLNGDGELNGYISSSVNGAVQSDVSYTGSYTVAANCTGTFTIASIIFDDLFASPSGNEFTFIQTDEATYPGSDQDVTSANAQRVAWN
jgi:hypothetical protein